MKDKKHFDVIIIGGSYSGLAAGMALGRALRQVLIIDSGNPANARTPHSHNFLTHDGKAPGEISKIARQQLEKYSTVKFMKGLAAKGKKDQAGFDLETDTGESFRGKKLIFATGVKDIMSTIPGYAECWGISVLHCPYCHGYEVRETKTGILANGESGFELSSLISNWTSDLTLYTNGRSTLTPEQTERLGKHRININEAEIELLEHRNGCLQNIAFKNGNKAPLRALYARSPFVQHSDIPESLGCELTDEAYIKLSGTNETSVRGVFACGDNTTRLRTVANAVAMGTTAGMMLNKQLIEEEF